MYVQQQKLYVCIQKLNHVLLVCEYYILFFNGATKLCVNDKIANKKIKSFHGIEKSFFFIYLFMLCALIV